MEKEDFITFEPLKRLIKTSEKGIRQMHFKKGEPTKLFYKSTLNDFFLFGRAEIETSLLGSADKWNCLKYCHRID